MSLDVRFKAKVVQASATSLVEERVLPVKPDLSKLLTDAHPPT